MFVLNPNPEFTTRVTVKVPAVGGPVEMAFTARFLALSAEELDAAMAEPTAAFLRRVLRGWEDVVDADGHPVPFTEATRDQLIGTVAARAPLLRRYREGLAGADAGN